MRIRIEFEVPNWTRWVAVGIVLGFAGGYGIANVHAADVTLSTTWSEGDILTAASLNKNFLDLKNAIVAQQGNIETLAAPSCPPGYTLTTPPLDIVLCRKGVDEMVRVNSGWSAFWIDRYEAGIWDHADGTGHQYGVYGADYPGYFPVTGQYDLPLYAVSQSGITPSAYLTWLQADAACEASGKRLMTREEWFRASRGTRDPNLSEGANGTCVTSAAKVRNTGGGTDCVSRWGVQDMAGNLWEWTAEWEGSPPVDANNLQSGYWPSGFAGDSAFGITSLTNDTQWDQWGKHPAAICRGGCFADSTAGGVFAVNYMYSPAYRSNEVGVRCVISR